MKRHAVVLSFLAALTLPAWLLAHEGHAHKVMGTVTALDANHVEIVAKDGKKVSILLNKETKYTNGKTPVNPADIKVGERVVLSVVEEGGKQTAKEVLLGSGPKPVPEKH